jgi:poly(3-hydroxybutyrate) depolymerase
LGANVELEKKAVDSVPTFIDSWSKRNGCRAQTITTWQKDQATCEAYQDCQAEVVICTDEILGHTWPGATSHRTPSCEARPNGYLCNLWKDGVGAVSPTIDANTMIWEFFKKYSLP